MLIEPGIPAMIANGTWPAELPFVVLMPQYSDFDANSHCAFGDDLDAFLRGVAPSYHVDPARMYLTGVSCGAIGIWDYLAYTDHNVIAAAVPIAGHLADAKAKAGCAISTTPTWTFHGALDDLIPLDMVQDAIEELRACTDPKASELRLTVYPDADHDESRDERTYDGSGGHDVFAWMLKHRLGD